MYREKYLKYKKKYMELKKQKGGAINTYNFGKFVVEISK